MTNNYPAIDPTCNTHTDPGQYWDWNHFMALVRQFRNGSTPAPRPAPTTPALASVAITGANPLDFTQTNTCGTSVAAGKTCTISVTFGPTATGARAATPDARSS